MSNNDKYHVIKNVLNKDYCALLTDYVLLKSKTKNIKRNDYLKNVHREYGDPLMETLLQKLTPEIELVTGKSLWPTLSFYYLYKNGNQLLKHTDRSSCEYVAGLCIGADHEFKKNGKTWPLILDVDNKETEIHLDYGDLLVYKGIETIHWRNKFDGSWFISAIFGYVDQNGPYNFQKFDQRKSLGLPHVGMFRWSYGVLKNKLFK